MLETPDMAQGKAGDILRLLNEETIRSVEGYHRSTQQDEGAARVEVMCLSGLKNNPTQKRDFIKYLSFDLDSS